MPNVIKLEEFKCRACGTCCHNQPGILLSIRDVFQMSEKLGMEPAAFMAKYAKKRRDSRRQYAGWEADFGRPCRFQAPDGKCSVYEARPSVCRAWPFSMPIFYSFELIQANLKHTQPEIANSGCSVMSLPGDTEWIPDDDLVDHWYWQILTIEFTRKYHGAWSPRNAVRYYEKGLKECQDSGMRQQIEALMARWKAQGVRENLGGRALAVEETP